MIAFSITYLNFLAFSGVTTDKLGLVILIIFGLSTGISAVLKLTDRLKGRKPDAQDLQTFATKKEHESLVGRVDKIEGDNSFENRATQRALGRIEGKLDSLDH